MMLLLEKLFGGRKNVPFDEIIGHDHIKKLFHMTLTSNEPMHILLMETGIVSETKFRKIREGYLKTSIFATCNDPRKLSDPLLSRFFVVGTAKNTIRTEDYCMDRLSQS